MIFYLIPAGNGQPEELAGTQNDARQLCKGKGLRFDADDMQHDIPTSKWELMNYINVLMHQRDGAVEMHLTRDEIVNSNTPEAQAEAKRLMNPSPLDQSIAFDDAFEAMPLAQKLHFAALAMEAAREELK